MKMTPFPDAFTKPDMTLPNPLGNSLFALAFLLAS